MTARVLRLVALTAACCVAAAGTTPTVAASAATTVTAAAPAATMPGADQIVSRTLPNGLEVFVWPDHDIPNVAMYTWFRVGSRNERPGLTGLAHFFEHMMFNGTKAHPGDEFTGVMEARGGSNNAYTTTDVTVYQDWFPASAIELVFELEADRMRHLAFDPKVVENERGVVYSERRMRIDDDSFGTLAEQMQATAYIAHSYQIPTIGWPSDIEGWKVADLQAFYRQYYAPDNAVVFVVGDVEPEAAFALAAKHFGPLEAQPQPVPMISKEPAQLGERRLRVVREAQAPLIAMAWHAYAAPDRETRVLEVLLSILGSGNSSRLHQRLVEQERAAVEVGVSLDQGFDPGLAWVYALIPPDGDAAKTERLIDEEISRLVKDGPTAAELAKARNQALAGFWHGLETVSGKAQALGDYEVFHGDYRKLFDAPAVYEGITADEVRQAAATVLRPANRTVGVLEPGSTVAAGARLAPGDTP